MAYREMHSVIIWLSLVILLPPCHFLVAYGLLRSKSIHPQSSSTKGEWITNWYAYRGFSCDVISSQFCKSSYSRPPCWFPVTTVRYWKTQPNVPELLIYTARFSLHQVHGSQCTKEYYTKYSWRTLADVCMVSEVPRVVPCCQVLL